MLRNIVGEYWEENTLKLVELRVREGFKGGGIYTTQGYFWVCNYLESVS